MKRRWWIAIGIGYAAGIFAASSLPLRGLSLSTSGLDKLIHATEYALFFFIIRKAAPGRAWIPLAIAILYAGSDELHQAFVPGRHAGIDDFAADLAGIGLMAALIAFFQRCTLLARIGQRILAYVISRKED
mgnify:CR=1 FL=1